MSASDREPGIRNLSLEMGGEERSQGQRSSDQAPAPSEIAANRIAPGLLQRKIARRAAQRPATVAPQIQRQPKPGDQKKPDPPVGTNHQTDFGEYWVVPDGTAAAKAALGAKGEIIQQSAYAKIEAAWNAIKAGTGKLVVSETDKGGGAHAGFKDSVMKRLGALLSKPKGRKLVVELTNGSKKCTIRPSAAKLFGGAETNAVGGLGAGAPGRLKADKSHGAGADSFIELDPNVGDADVTVNDAAGNAISDPVYIFLGHEMIHARHIAAGTVEMGAPAAAAYGIKEEETTIDKGDLTENDLRSEHGLTKRFGHGGDDTRP